MSIHEECGVFGIYSPEDTEAANLAYYGLYALQHRGQESCGIYINKEGKFHSHKGIGLVSDVFTKDTLSALPTGNIAVAHTRYGTTGGSSLSNCQPLEVKHHRGNMVLAHNGNLSNADSLRTFLENSGAIFSSTSDTEVISYIITREHLMTEQLEDAVSSAMNIIDGAYSLVIMDSNKLICARDPRGFRPLCYGKTKDGKYIVASESCAIQAVGADFIRNVEPGEIVVFSKEGVYSKKEHCGQKEKKLCIFEYIYFARPDSIIDGVSVHNARVKAGRILAEEYPVEADVVIGVPDSGLDAALGFSKQSGIPYEIGFIKNKYIGRTFIAPDNRFDMVKIKLSVIEEVIRGKRVVLVDDSIVRGTTSARIVKLLRDYGAKEVHMRISAPPFLHPCYYGTDIDSEDNLIACKYSVPEICKIVGADSLGYLPMEGLFELSEGKGYCDACFSGDYPTQVDAAGRKMQFEK